jgi:PAS domain S-box-containing protein
MKERIKNVSEAEILRKKAEELFKSQAPDLNFPEAESDILKLNHELSVHQIELEIQNNELIRAKEELEVAVEKYTDLYDFAPTAYLTLSADGQIVLMNLSASKMIGKERHYLIKSIFSSYIIDDAKQTFLHFLNEIFESRSEQTCEITILKNGKIPVNVYLIGIITKNGDSCEINMVDVTERKLAEDKLKTVNKELEQSLSSNADKELFISLLAHDLRNPFGVLLGHTEMLLGDIRSHDISYIENLIGDVYNSAQNTYALLEDLLKWSRMRNGRYPFELQQISFKNLCSEVVNSLNPIASAKKILINCIDDKEIVLIADEDMLKAIIRNLLSNAIKFTNNYGLIKISVDKIDSNVIFSVSDNGIGIETERLESLFEISHSSTFGTSNEKGTGLGLLLCKEFVEKHGGKIWVKSESGKGSVFYFNIPVISEISVKHLVDPAPENDNRIKSLKILIADDDAALSMILGTMVTKYSREILYAQNGEEAIGICKKNPDIDLILMDYYMPEMNGYEATKLIRDFNKDVIIIIETANELTQVTEKLPREGVSDFLFKPYSRVFLNELIIKHFKNKNIATI